MKKLLGLATVTALLMVAPQFALAGPANDEGGQEQAVEFTLYLPAQEEQASFNCVEVIEGIGDRQGGRSAGLDCRPIALDVETTLPEAVKERAHVLDS